MIHASHGFRYRIHSKWGLYGILKGSDLEKKVFDSNCPHSEAMNAIESSGLCITSEEIKTHLGVAKKIPKEDEKQVFELECALKDYLQTSWRYRRLASECKRSYPNHVVVLLYELIDFEHTPVVLSFPSAPTDFNETTQAYRARIN